MLRVTTEQKRGKLMLNVEGRLAGQWVATLEQCWRDLRASSPAEKFSINLCGVSFIDAAGKALLKEIHRQGGHLLAEGCLNQAVVKEIVAQSGDNKSSAEGAQAAPKAKKSHIIFYLILFTLVPGALTVHSRSAASGGSGRAHGPLDATAPPEIAAKLRGSFSR